MSSLSLAPLRDALSAATFALILSAVINLLGPSIFGLISQALDILSSRNAWTALHWDLRDAHCLSSHLFSLDLYWSSALWLARL
jgi:hypothetical protein